MINNVAPHTTRDLARNTVIVYEPLEFDGVNSHTGFSVVASTAEGLDESAGEGVGVSHIATG
jgi:hypothetical protein